MSRLLLQDVRKSFGATAALRGVSLGVGVGEVPALIGENGAGMGTLMKIPGGAHCSHRRSHRHDCGFQDSTPSFIQKIHQGYVWKSRADDHDGIQGLNV